MGAEDIIFFCKIPNSKFLKGLRHSALVRSERELKPVASKGYANAKLPHSTQSGRTTFVQNLAKTSHAYLADTFCCPKLFLT